MDAYQQIESNLARCRARMERAARKAGREPRAIELLPVTKYVGAEVVRLLYRAGLKDFAESRVQRAVDLARETPELEGARWHLVGHLQRNKVRRALETFKSIHSLDSLRLAQALAAEGRRRSLPELYVEVNVGREAQKTGIAEADLDALLEFILREGHLELKGLMTMAPYHPDPEASRPYFRRLAEIRDDRLRRALLPAGAGLSMGMSADFPVAIEEGATVVRIGSLLFEGLPQASQ